MRIRNTDRGLSVQAVAGTYVVLLGFDMSEADCAGLRGFAIHRTDHAEQESYWLEGMKTFRATDPGLAAGGKVSTRQHPVQSFTWSDYTAKPGRHYTYRILALKGPVTDLQPAAEVTLEVHTETPENGEHDIYFNRGSAGSQAYAQRFGDVAPDEQNPSDPRWAWLSRGLSESILDFINAAVAGDSLRVCAYEFKHTPVLQAFLDAEGRGVDVKIIYDRRKPPVSDANDRAIDAVGIRHLCIPRTKNPSAIMHNKFIVRARNGAQEVLTGGTNFSTGGIFGHSNEVHVVQDPIVAQAYLDYWDFLRNDPEYDDSRPRQDATVPAPGLPPMGTSVVFSPNSSLDALNWYADLARNAGQGLFMTFAFGMHAAFQAAYTNGAASVRFALLEKKTRPMELGPARTAEEERIQVLRNMEENKFALGSHLSHGLFDRWVAETLTGLNSNVRYSHTKYMVVDPLGPDPIVIAGSANFSEASTDKNDENMLVIRGDQRVADIYLGEFMRMYSHFAFRESAQWQNNTPWDYKHLREDDWWAAYFGDNFRSRQRAYFAGQA